ncbi:MAG: AGE family epimerase/isomerase [Chitinophagaceae bacterium]
MKHLIGQLKTELSAELERILSYWMQYGIDETYGGFKGRVDHANHADMLADKGSVLNSRILWSFSAAYSITGKQEYLHFAEKAYQYFIQHFIDKQYGGVYWTVDYKGNSSNPKKQIYAQAFAVYAFSEYYRASNNDEAKQHAITLFKLIEKYSYDNLRTGYFDAFAEDWTAMDDIRLSEKDANEKKTMNTHLHILEAYSTFYKIWPDKLLKERIKGLLQNFADYIIDKKSNHLILFFDENWQQKGDIVSYGHDIEAAWLLQEAAESINDADLIALTKKYAVYIANAAREGLDADGGLWYEYEPSQHHLVKEKHWWPQAEAIVGFFNAWEVSGEESFLNNAINVWQFTQNYICDYKTGEWVWGVYEDYSIMSDKDKLGLWKCPYHNSRACVEIMRRVEV